MNTVNTSLLPDGPHARNEISQYPAMQKHKIHVSKSSSKYAFFKKIMIPD
jgi:hypothetical protein